MKTGWKRRSSAGSFSLCAVLVEGRRAHGAQLSAREHRLEQVPGGDRRPRPRPLRRSCGARRRSRGINGSSLAVMSWRTALSRSSNWPRYLAPATSAPTSSAQTRLPFSPSGTSPATIRSAQALGDCRLPHAGLADQHRVVLRAPREHLDRAPDLLVPPDHGVELALLGERVRSRPYFSSAWYEPLEVLRRDPLAAADVLECLQQGDVARDELEP